MGEVGAADRIGDESAEVDRLLAAHPLTEPLAVDLRRRVAQLAEVREFRAGEVVVRQGGPGDAAFLVISGRLLATVDGAQVGVVGRGETVGEMALITGERRSATLTAGRPSKVVRIGAEEFASVLSAYPEAYRGLTAQVVARLERTLSGRPNWTGHATVVGVTATDPELGHSMTGQLTDALREQGCTVATGAARTRPSTGEAQGDGRDAGSDPADLAELEAGHDVVLVPTTFDELVGVADNYDRTLLFARSHEAIPELAPQSISDLVLQHPAALAVPHGTSRWLRALEPNQHHHVRADSGRDMGRLARRLCRRENVLVLGGGGARGLAHLGAYRALTEAGVEIDAIVGVSAGALFGAGMAMDWTPDEAIERSYSMVVGSGRLVDFTVPLVALGSGRRITEGLQRWMGTTVNLEDLWRPMTCLTADLTTLSARLHQSGPLWRAVRASVAVPGVFPPVLDGDSVLVDGGVIDNLPIGTARRLYPGATIISSDVGRRHEPLSVNIPGDGIVTGWQALRSRIGRRRRTPGIVHLLYRLTALGGGASASERGDVHISHAIDGVSLFDFSGGRPAIESGYQLTKRILDESPIFTTR